MSTATREASYDPARLARAARLAVKRLGPSEFAVQGSRGVRYVNLEVDPHCECEDRYWGNHVCKHILASRLASGDMALIQALGDMLLRAERARAGRSAKRAQRAQRALTETPRPSAREETTND